MAEWAWGRRGEGGASDRLSRCGERWGVTQLADGLFGRVWCLLHFWECPKLERGLSGVA